MTSEIQIGQGDLIEVYLDQDDMLLALANDLPVEVTRAVKVFLARASALRLFLPSM